MNTNIEKRWLEYCKKLSQTADRCRQSSIVPADQIDAALQLLLDSDPPRTETELDRKIHQGDRLQLQWNRDQNPYQRCSNHEPIPWPTSSIAEQAEQAAGGEADESSTQSS